MDNERIREVCLALPLVKETLNWGHVLVYWVGEREIGGKMFALTLLDGNWMEKPGPVLSFHCGAERYHELLEVEGLIPAPHFARANWVAMERWDALRPREVEQELVRARDLIYQKMPPKTKAALALPEKERARLIRERKKVLAAKAETPVARKKSKKA